MSEMDRDILAALAAPFPSSEIKWKPQRTTQDKTRAEAVAYIDARNVSRRLDEVVGWDWAVDYQPILGGPQNVVSVICRLCVMGMTRSGIGSFTMGDGSQADPWKSAESDALKRAAVNFGIGRYLYELGQTWVPYDAQRRRLVEEPTLPAWALPEDERGKSAPPKQQQQPPVDDGFAPERPKPQPAETSGAKKLYTGDPGAVIIGGGKYKGRTVLDVATHDMPYAQWMVRNAEEKGQWYPNTQAMRDYLLSLTEGLAPEPFDESNAPFSDGQSQAAGTATGPNVVDPATIPGVQKGLMKADATIGTLNKGVQQKVLTSLRSLQAQSGWEDPHLVGHIAKHFSAPVRAGITTSEEAILKLTIEQATTLKGVLETVIHLRQAFAQTRKKPEIIISWVNNNLGKNYTERKDVTKLTDELEQNERKQLLEYLSTDDEAEVADLSAEFEGGAE